MQLVDGRIWTSSGLLLTWRRYKDVMGEEIRSRQEVLLLKKKDDWVVDTPGTPPSLFKEASHALRIRGRVQKKFGWGSK